MRRFKPAGPLHFVTAKNLCISHYYDLGFIAQKSARQSAEMQRKPGSAGVTQSVFFPNLLKPLPLACVIAKDMNCVTVPQPAMKLLEKFPPLRLREMRFQCPSHHRTKCIQAFKPLRMNHSLPIRSPLPSDGRGIKGEGSGEWRGIRGKISGSGEGWGEWVFFPRWPALLGYMNHRHPFLQRLFLEVLPANEQRFLSLNLTFVLCGTLLYLLRFADHKYRTLRQIIQQAPKMTLDFGLRTSDFGLQQSQFPRRREGYRRNFLS